MTRRTKGKLIVIAILVALVGTEVGLNLWRGSEAMVQVENVGADPIDDLVVTCGDNRVVVGRVSPGESAKVWLRGHGPRMLQLTFSQRGNALGSFQLPGFDPADMNREGFKLVLRIRPNQVEKFQDDAEPATPLGRFVHKVWTDTLESLGIEPDIKTN
jgi:hypothetical protein